MTDETFTHLKRDLIEARLARFDELRNKWDFYQAMYFCMVLITTIGYGHR